MSKDHYKALLAQGLSSKTEGEAPDLDGYEVLRRLGQGGMSTVYLAKESALDRLVALKVFKTDSLDAVSLERFRQEAVMMARIQHPHIVSLHGITYDEDDHPCTILEYVSGGDLRSHLMQQPRFPVAKALPIAIDICRGLEALHAEAIVHRDINPSNILLTEQGRAKVADLGIVLNKHPEQDSPALTMTGTFVGTMAYLAPEQMSQSRENIDHRTDIWAVGVLLFEMLAGSPPQAVLISDLLQEVPKPLRPVVKKCLRRNPDDRYSSVAELREELEKIRKPRLYKLALLLVLPLIALLASLFFANRLLPELSFPSSESSRSNSERPASSASPASTPKNLLEQLSLNPTRGEWSLENNVLRCLPHPSGACIALPSTELSHNYDLSFTLTRHQGKHSAVVYLPTAAGPVNLDLDGWETHLSGLQNINGQDLRSHGEAFTFRLENNRAYQIKIHVRQETVTISIDGKQRYRWSLAGKSLTHTALWQAPIQLGLGAWDSEVSFQEVMLIIHADSTPR